MSIRKISTALVVGVMLTANVLGITSCSKDKRSIAKNKVVKVEESSTWYNLNTTDINVEGLTSLRVTNSFIKTDDGYATTIYGFEESASKSYEGLLELNEDGSVKNLNIIRPEDIGLDSRYWTEIHNISYVDGQFRGKIYCSYLDELSYTYHEEEIFYNFTKNEVEDVSYLESAFPSDAPLTFVKYLENHYVVAVNDGYSTPATLVLAKDNEIIETFNIEREISGYYWTSDARTDGDNIIVETKVDSDSGNTKYVEYFIDTSTLTSKAGDEEYEKESYISYPNDSWMVDYTDDQGKSYSLKSDGVYREDELVLDFSDSYCNPYRAQGGCLIDATEDKYVIVVSYMDQKTLSYELTVLAFDKADTNPNAGKTILTVGFMGNIDYAIGTTIANFNSTSSDYFIKAKSYEVNPQSTENKTNSRLEIEAILTNSLMMDLINGEGPDILLNTSEYAQLNNDLYLIDLAEFMNESFEDGVIFDNVIKAMTSSDGKLYQVPVTFTVNGIIVDSKIADGRTGFTFEEYKEYVDKTCNGKNPIAPYGGQLETFDLIYPTMSELMYDEDGNLNMNNEVLEKIASYCLTNIGDREEEPNIDNSYDGNLLIVQTNSYVEMPFISRYLYSNPVTKDLTLMGIPSVDGRGPSVSSSSSVAISSACCDEEGAKAFVKYLFTDSSIYDEVGENPIMVEASRNYARTIVDYMNRNYQSQIDNNPGVPNIESTLHSFGFYYFEDSVIDEYINLLSSATCSTSCDSNILLIINEEIQAYFAGQKTFDEVSGIIQNRAQTVIDER